MRVSSRRGRRPQAAELSWTALPCDRGQGLSYFRHLSMPITSGLTWPGLGLGTAAPWRPDEGGGWPAAGPQQILKQLLPALFFFSFLSPRQKLTPSNADTTSSCATSAWTVMRI